MAATLRECGIDPAGISVSDDFHQGNPVFAVDVDGGRVEVHVTARPDSPPAALEHTTPPAPRWQVLILAAPLVDGPAARRALSVCDRLEAALRPSAASLTEAEVDTIWSAMPLLARYATPAPELAGWALIFRDHYVENSVGFLRAAERAGFAPEWIYALSKGDRTLRRDRIHSWFLRRGYRSDILDNSVVNGTASAQEVEHARIVGSRVDRFILDAHARGRRVLIVDDGGVIALGHGSGRLVTELPDAALELTVSGLKRISAADLGIPVFNLARSAVKSKLAYNEIADSCVRRLRAIVPGQKFIGRRVLSAGFGTLGARIARQLRALGCRVTVVDTDVLALIQAAEQGFDTCRTVREALLRTRPFLIVSSAGEEVLTRDDLPLLGDGTLLAGFATKDFSLLGEGRAETRTSPLPGVGVRHTLPDGSSVVLLGDGRSLNLFEYEGIPNRGYDAYRAGTLIAAKELCRRFEDMPAGIHTRPVDAAVDAAGLFEAYYEEYLADTAGVLAPTAAAVPRTETPVG